MNELERVITDEEREYAARLIIIESRKQHVAGLQSDLDTLSQALNHFERQYRIKLGGVHAEIDRLRTDINDYRERMNVLKVRAASRDAQPIDPPPFDDDPNAEPPPFDQFIPAKKRPKVSADTMASLGRVYRELAKRFHPDLVSNPAERARREAIMLRINDAYDQRNLAALEAIARETEHDYPGFGQRPIMERIAWAALEVARLDGLVVQLETQIASLHASRSYEYWRASEKIEETIERLSTEAHEKSARLREKLTELKTAHDKLRVKVEARERFRQISARRLHAS